MITERQRDSVGSRGAEVQRTTVLGPGCGERVSAATVENIVGVQKGTDGGKAVMLVAHYDSEATGPGAGDAAAGVADEQ